MTVRKRKDTGKWTCSFYYNGERIERTLKFARTRKQAEQAEAVIMTQVFQEIYGFEAKTDKLFENFVVETFLPYSETNKKSFVNDVSICRVLVRAFKGKNLRQINPPMIEEFKQRFLATRTARGERSPATVNNHLRVLSKIFSLAIDAEYVDSNPCRRVRKLRPNNQRTRVLSVEEERRLLVALKDNRVVREIVLVALNTGMRRGEIFNLSWPNLDFERGLILIEESKAGNKRIVPMNGIVRTILSARPRNKDHVFPSPRTGKRLTDVKRSFHRALKDARITNFHFHDLRHTAATRMSEAGANSVTLATLLGHSNTIMTARYTHATDSAIRRAVDNISSIFRFGDETATKNKRQGDDLP